MPVPAPQHLFLPKILLDLWNQYPPTQSLVNEGQSQLKEQAEQPAQTTGAQEWIENRAHLKPVLPTQMQSSQSQNNINTDRNNAKSSKPQQQTRQVKLRRYLLKKARRVYGKKVTYENRKQVAEVRLRVKGRFVTRRQVLRMLGLEQNCGARMKQLRRWLAQFQKTIE